jgi:Ca2+:H+ antiporter
MPLLKPRLDWLLVCVPIAAWLHYATSHHTATFIVACIAIIPVAGWMGKATEHLAEHTGEGVGGLLNATFGNAAELVIALVALSKGMHEVVKASITGSIIGNILLVLGAACLAGGLKHRNLPFNASAARSQASMLLLAVVALVMPALYHILAPGAEQLAHERDLSFEIAVVLILTYVCALIFSLVTHKQLFTGNAAAAAAEHGGGHKTWSVGKAVGVLAGATALVAVIAEWMVGSIEHAAHTLGMNAIFVGVIVVAVVGNAAEHSTAVLMAMKQRMDLAVGIALGSSVQVALFVAPVLVFASYAMGPAPLDLVFTPAEVVAVALAVFITEQVVGDGESNWLEGVQLLSVYAVIGMMFYWLPG